jgi:hypothetical protein
MTPAAAPIPAFQLPLVFVPTPHDAFAKYVFQVAARAAEVIAAALGVEAARLFDWGAIEAAPSEIADDALQRYFPDLRFSGKFAGEDLRIDILFEHQSEVDRLMPLRFFRETNALWNSAVVEKEPGVPFVLNVVLYNGLKPWSGPRELWEIIRGGAALRASIPHLLPAMPFLVLDLAGRTDAEIDTWAQTSVVKLALRLLKHARRGEGVQTLRDAGPLMADLPTDVLQASMRYVYQVDPSATVPGVAEAVRGVLGRKGEEVAVTIGEQLIEQGRRDGLVQGKVEGKAELLIRIIQHRGLALTDDQRGRIETCRDATQLDRWAEAALDATSAGEVLASATTH